LRRVAGIDVGGTFTDLLLYEAEAGEVGTIRLAKIPTTADNQAHGVLAAIARERPVPVYFIGVGEKLEDLQTFDAREFAQALVG
jgi:signal recognition particle GTPase